MKTLDDLKRAFIFIDYENANDKEWEIHNAAFNEGWNNCIDHLHAQGLLMVWKPIETAPKDETPIMVVCDRVDGEIGEPYKPDYPVSVQFSYGHWYVNDTVYYCAEAINPTAWMPLPKYEVTK